MVPASVHRGGGSVIPRFCGGATLTLDTLPHSQRTHYRTHSQDTLKEDTLSHTQRTHYFALTEDTLTEDTLPHSQRTHYSTHHCTSHSGVSGDSN